MRSLRESVHQLLSEKIETLGLSRYFDITDRSITCTLTGGEIIFTGLFAHISTLKSLENIGLVWVEEAESVSQRSLEVLTPTIRAAGSEIWLTTNPTDPDAPSQQYVAGKRSDTRHVHVIHSDNPWFASTPLEAERAYLERTDDDLYRHVWMGECRSVSDALIFKGRFAVEEFQPRPDWSVYHGLDFGFSRDPSAAVRCYVGDGALYISHEHWSLHTELDALSDAIERDIPGSKQERIHCDNARPESISHLTTHGHPYALAAAKWPNSITEGIAVLRNFQRIVVHPRCSHTLDELRSWSYKVDKLTGIPTVEPEDRNNHLLDATRYALVDVIRASKSKCFNAIMESYGLTPEGKPLVPPAPATAEKQPEPKRISTIERARRENAMTFPMFPQ